MKKKKKNSNEVDSLNFLKLNNKVNLKNDLLSIVYPKIKIRIKYMIRSCEFII